MSDIHLSKASMVKVYAFMLSVRQSHMSNTFWTLEMLSTDDCNAELMDVNASVQFLDHLIVWGI